MDYVVDTQSFIWFVEDDKRLSPKIKQLMENDDAGLLISIASLWEITIKTSLGKLTLSGDITKIIKEFRLSGFELLQINPEDLITLSNLEYIHRDPFDRIIIAQAITADLPLISSDDMFSKYPVKLVQV
jgi:PIN domain nuclease of toxin-antitoxin system